MTGPKRLSDKQLAANRANAQRSTGPRTLAGIARSRWNALTHGALAQAVIPASPEPHESRQAFDDLLAALRDEVAPGSAIEELLVERIPLVTLTPRKPSLADQVRNLSASMSNKRQLRELMTRENPSLREVDDEQLLAARALLTEMQAQLAAQQKRQEAAQRDQRCIPPLPDALQFARYETTLERQLYRALDVLERLQRLRHGEDVPPPLRLSVYATIAGPRAPEEEV